jgi:SOS-response transcriptional repressor LexA
MGWASAWIAQLAGGKTVEFRPRGNSMSGKIESGQLVTIEPLGEHEIETGDIVLCKVNGTQYLHLVKACSNNRFQIGNNRGRINGWTTRRNIFGIVTKIRN